MTDSEVIVSRYSTANLTHDVNPVRFEIPHSAEYVTLLAMVMSESIDIHVSWDNFLQRSIYLSTWVGTS